MPASDSSCHRSLTLPNGLHIVLCSAPRLKRCAAALRVATGSHDVSGQWPGLAHFLEHLFFLGTERFPANQNLMAYVQRHGGQVNASTRERTTDFFFELAPPVFAAGLERLCEMLAHPRMALADQQREREVLHAEFIAWSRDDAARDQLKRLQAVSPRHPLRGFHAGNRFSLPVPRPAFQRALRDFYQRFYQAGQMTLSLAGPQTLDELQALAQTCGGYLPTGQKVEQLRPPSLVEECDSTAQSEDNQSGTHLIFACEDLPPGHEQAATFLCTWINDLQPGGLLARLRDHGLATSVKAQVLYAFEGQVLIDIEVGLTDAITSIPSAHCLIFSWLSFFKTHYPPLLNEYTLVEQRRLAVSGALALARHYSAQTGGPGLSDQAIQALDTLLQQLTPETLLGPLTEPFGDEPLKIDWRLPLPNAFLRPTAAPTTHAATPRSFTFSDSLPAAGEASVYLRWALTAPQPTLFRMLNESLNTLSADALQAGVAVAFSAYGSFWQLKLSGLAEPLPAILEQALTLLAHPGQQTLARYGEPDQEPVPIPIRQLLKTLPDHYLTNAGSPETHDLPNVWANAHWMGFATGLQGPTESTVSHALGEVPGTPQAMPMPMPAALMAQGRTWHAEASDTSENAVLLFYPAPTSSIEDEAQWRLFAQLIQAPFYQRLRVELQLGYAVFSGFRQICGQGGLLFGVQSPNTRAEELVEHIEVFMGQLPSLIESADLPAQLSALQHQLDPIGMDSQPAAEMLWQAHLAGHGADYPERLQHLLSHQQVAVLKRVASQTALPQTPRFCLANRPRPLKSGLAAQ